MRALLVGVLVALVACGGAVSPHNKVKGATKPTHHAAGESRGLGGQALIQGQASASQTNSESDEAVVEAEFGDKLVNQQNLKEYLTARSFSDIGLIDDLIIKVACVVRLQEKQAVDPLTTASLQNYLDSQQLSKVGSKDQLLDRSCRFEIAERRVINYFAKAITDITDADLKSALSTMGFVSTAGSRSDLLIRLGNSMKNVEVIQSLLNDPHFDATQVNDLLSSHKLDTTGTVDIQLQRLVDALVLQSENSLPPGISEHCDMVLESGVCIANGRKVLTADAVQAGLKGRWTFDDVHGHDSSGGRHHVKEISSFGPGINGLGQSAKFDGTSMLEIPHSDKLTTTDNFCVSLWVFLLTDSTGQWRTLFHKGERDHERTPTVFLEPQTRGIEFFVTTTDDSQPAGERVWSNSFLPMRRWTHVAACAEGRNLRLYINGILDAENTTQGSVIHNQGPMYLGNDPWRPSGGIHGYVDEMKYFTRTLTVDEIQAEAATALGVCEPAFAELGCMGCSLDNCPKTCRSGYRMCTQRDHYMCGYHISRSMGWASSDTRIWKAEDGVADDIPAGESGLCVCCKIGDE